MRDASQKGVIRNEAEYAEWRPAQLPMRKPVELDEVVVQIDFLLVQPALVVLKEFQDERNSVELANI